MLGGRHRAKGIAVNQNRSQPEPIQDLFGAWQVSALAPAPGVSFDTQSAGPEAAPIFRLELPADARRAAARLDEEEVRLRAVQAALADVPQRVDRLVQQAQVSGGVGVSFAAAETTLPEPEAEALELLHALEMPAVGLSFAVEGEQRRSLDQAYEDFRADMDNLFRLVSNFAWVETRQAEALVGRTVVSWSGDLSTTWKLGLPPENQDLHRRSLQQALATRHIVMHALVVTTSSAAKLALLLTTPASAVLALPVAWKLVKQIMADLEKYKQIAKIPL